MWVLVLLVIMYFSLRGLAEPYFGLLALLAVYIIQPGELYPVLAMLHLERVLALVVIISFFAHGNKLRFPRLTIYFLMFYGVMLLSIPTAFWPMNSAQACLQFLEIVVFHMLIVSLLTTEERIKQFIVLMVVLTGWLAATSLILYRGGVREVHMHVERATGLTSSGGDANTLGITLVIAMPLEFLMMRKANSKSIRWTGFAIFAISVITVLITGSRTSFIAMFAVLIMLMMRNARNLKFIPVFAILVPIIWLALPQQYKARYETVGNLKNDDSYQNRLLSWQGGIQMFLHNPLTGVGPDNYTTANGERYWPEAGPKRWLNAHSLYFKLLGELGLLGVFTFGLYLIGLIVKNMKLMKELPRKIRSPLVQQLPGYSNICLFALLLTGYSAHNLYRSTWFTLGAITGAISLLPRTLGTEDGAETTAPKPAKIPLWLQEPDPVALEEMEC